MNIYFVGGMPRAGSTLIMNLLGQNPNLQVTPTSGLSSLMGSMRQWFTKAEEVRAQNEEEMNERFKRACRQAVYGWAFEQTDSEEGRTSYIDKSRGWIEQYEFLETVLPLPPKIIVPVRDLRGICASMEKLFRANTLRIDPTQTQNNLSNLTMDGRVTTWVNTLPVGAAMNRVMDLFNRRLNDKLHFVRLEDLCSTPAEVMSKIYSYLEIPSADHDFNNIEQITREDDRVFGIPNLHKVHGKVHPCAQDWMDVLGPKVSKDLNVKFEWYQETFRYG